MKLNLDIPESWSHDFKIDKTGKFITLLLFVDFDLIKQIGHRTKKYTIRAMFDCYKFKDKRLQQTFVNLLDELNKQYHSEIHIQQRSH